MGRHTKNSPLAFRWNVISLGTVMSLVIFLIVAIYNKRKNNENEAERRRHLEDYGEQNNGSSFLFTLVEAKIFSLFLMLLIVLILAPCGFKILRRIGSKAGRFRMGAFGAALLMYGNLAIFFTVFLGFTRTVQNGENAVYQLPITLIAILYIIIGCVYTTFGIMVYRSEESGFISDRPSEPFFKSKKKAHADHIFFLWCVLAAASFLVLIITFVIIVIRDQVGAKQEEQQEGGGDDIGVGRWRLYTVGIWSIVLVIIFSWMGYDSLGSRGYPTQLLIGSFCGGVSILPCFFFAAFFLFAPFMSITGCDDENCAQQNSNLASTIFSFISLVLSISFGIFACTLFWDRETIVVANAADSSSVWFRKPVTGEETVEL
uniref:Uncharacterized protein n=1 Tax=Ditylum brightwellii TaxID=49249 RepID=A0A7S1YRY2_9STRA|mmetsp:Transcript_15294/g.22776  ORF Transcript_15294/g.22776 Transcript_15294/m.22776 type:complete len:374 (+) Transcript_15294:164-1285(+)